MAVGAAVAGTVLYRAVTGGCVASCRAYQVCDRQSGLCIQAECSPECAIGQECVREVDGRFRCVDDAMSFSMTTRSPKIGAVLDGGIGEAAAGAVD